MGASHHRDRFDEARFAVFAETPHQHRRETERSKLRMDNNPADRTDVPVRKDQILSAGEMPSIQHRLSGMAAWDGVGENRNSDDSGRRVAFGTADRPDIR